ncbi:MAG: PilZ domain-containing protein [Vallitaleaceae bacterium]|nr:PilZ domain-containing protein [Vallitaleaceae bacterium]
MGINEEKRKISRVNYLMKGKVKFKESLYSGEIQDFSLNGFSFCSEDVIYVDEGEKLAISLYIEDEEEVRVSEVDCIVVRRRENMLGVKFDIIDYDTLMLLREKLIHLVGDENKINDEFIKFFVGY